MKWKAPAHCNSSWMRTKSIRYYAGSSGNKPKYGTPKRKRGIPFWWAPNQKKGTTC
jgi:hypothetical protein